MIDAVAVIELGERTVLFLVPGSVPAFEFSAVVPGAGLDAGQPVSADLAERQHDVSVMIARIVAALGDRRVDGDIGDHAFGYELSVDELAEDVEPLLGGQLMREREIDFAAELGVVPVFAGVDVVPEFFAVGEPGRGALGQHDFAVYGAALAAVIVNLAGGAIDEAGGGTIGSGCDGGMAFGPTDDLRVKMVAGHGLRCFCCGALISVVWLARLNVA